MDNPNIILIVGGTSGIGKAVAHLAAEQGHTVVVTGRDTHKGLQTMESLQAKGGTADFIQTDIADSQQVEHLVAEVVRRYGRLDGACNSAAIDEGVGVALADVEEKDFDYQLSVNLKGVWLCMKYQIRQMLRQGRGSIVNVSSINGLGGAKGASVYSAAKSGLLALTKSAAQEYATLGIRINALCAGAFRTPMLERVFRQANPEDPTSVETLYNSFIPMNRIGEPGEAAEAILWLLSDMASYVTGHSLVVDGGMSASLR